jgi:hypothetical protein
MNLGWCRLNIGPLLPSPFASLRETDSRLLLVQGPRKEVRGIIERVFSTLLASFKHREQRVRAHLLLFALGEVS